jgi:hypothetical protein
MVLWMHFLKTPYTLLIKCHKLWSEVQLYFNLSSSDNITNGSNLYSFHQHHKWQSWYLTGLEIALYMEQLVAMIWFVLRILMQIKTADNIIFITYWCRSILANLSHACFSIPISSLFRYVYLKCCMGSSVTIIL